jgi:hypothetical protein
MNGHDSAATIGVAQEVMAAFNPDFSKIKFLQSLDEL